MMKLKVIYFPPYDKMAKTKKELIEIKDDKITVKELLNIIVKRHAKIKEYVDLRSDEKLRSRLIVVVEKDVASINDVLIGEYKIVKLLPPIAGG